MWSSNLPVGDYITLYLNKKVDYHIPYALLKLILAGFEVGFCGIYSMVCVTISVTLVPPGTAIVEVAV